ncbi:response regulator transcription factor [Streptomyces sp. SID9727]|uniref:response regulator transcription factor n=1 Tax=Streptomyces sp. SID9727 TaxID=2706114 RepID=UPI0013C634EA|nr:response regulator transcription factor [Streptomyces sp. SID9727]NEC66880.1 response regulator transcription factor [Streptomyces sp. SID9727]
MGDRSARHTLLVVEDDPGIRTLLTSALTASGHGVASAANGREALDEVERLRPDLVVLDVTLPDTDGFAVTRALRARGDYTPVLFLTARTDIEDRIIGLSSGGDDYVTKPFHIQEILLRIRAILRRTGSTPRPPAEQPPLRYADLTVDRERHTAHRGGEPVRLSPTEFRLLVCLVSQAEKVLAKQEILLDVWSYGFAGDTRIVDTYIKNLRRKIDRADRPLIHTVRGVGYCLRMPREDAR